MKLILSSCDFRNEKSKKVIMDNLPYPINKCRLLFIPNEKATEEAISGDVYYDRMQEFGFAKENVYVFDHNNPDKFRNLDIDVVYISGGNTFGTLNKIRKCGFEKDIINYVKSDVVYIGGSAGAHIASKNIKHVENHDENIVGLTDYSGLGLFDGVLICHYTDSRKYDFEQLSQYSEFKVYALTDEDSIVCITKKRGKQVMILKIRVMTADDYDSVVKLWTNSSGVGVNPDDSKENILKYLQRNPNTSFVAVENGKIVGAVLAGHDGYRGFIHHTAVSASHRGVGIGTKLVNAAVDAIRNEGINKVVLVAFKTNTLGNNFWEKQGFAVREDLYYRDLRINNI